MSVTQQARKAAVEPAVQDTARGGALLEAAFAQYQAELLGTLYYLVGNLEDARDALQEAAQQTTVVVDKWRKFLT